MFFQEPPQLPNLFDCDGTLKYELSRRLPDSLYRERQLHGRIDLEDKPKINVEKLIQLIQTQPTEYRFEGGNCLRFTLKNTEAQNKIATVQQLLSSLL